MDRKELIKLCKYYKGEDVNPFANTEKELLWYIERSWIDEVSQEKPSVLLAEYCNNFAHAFPEYSNDKYIPMSLKATLHDRYTHHGGSDEGFIAWMKRFYKVKTN